MNIPRGLDRVARVSGALALTALTACAASLEAGARGRAGTSAMPDGPDGGSEPAVPAQVVLTRTEVEATRCEGTDGGHTCEAFIGRQDRIEIGAGPGSVSAGEREVFARAGVGFVNQVGGGSNDGNAVVVEVAVGADLFRDEAEGAGRLPWYKHLIASLRGRFARVPEELRSSAGTIRHEVGTEVVDACLGWQPHLTSGDALRLDAGIGVGVGHIDERELPDGMSVNGETTVVNPWDLGVTLTGDNVGVRVGGNCTVAGQPTLQTCGAGVQLQARF